VTENISGEQMRGSGSDRTDERRPGVPMEHSPRPSTLELQTPPEQQTASGEVLMSVARHRLTATFGSANPPSGLSGVLRRIAYRFPDHRAPKWMLLLLADRLNATERHPAGAALVLGGVAVMLLWRRRR
jgi:uncharacterized protein (TIGR03382 family)